MTGNELTRVDVWLQTLLAGDTALQALVGNPARVYSDVADPAATYPFIVHQHQGSADVRGVGPGRIMLSGVWLVRAVAQTTTWTALAACADRIDRLLQGNPGGPAGTDGAVFSSVREQPFKQVENIEGGEQIRHLGGLFRILVQVP